MNKRLTVLLAATCIFSVASCLVAPQDRNTANTPPPADSRTGRFTLMALGDNIASDIENLDQRHDLMIASDDVKPEALEAFRLNNPDALVFCYFNTSDINGDSPYASYQRTWNDVDPHENWFHHDSTGERVKIYYPKYQNRCAFDTGNAGLRDYLAARVIEIFETGLYDGVQLDNVSTEFPFYERLVGNWISSVPVNLTPEDWVGDEVGMLREIRSQSNAAGFVDKTIIFNHMRSGEPDESRAYLAEIDGANCESWMTASVELEGRWGWKEKVEQVREAASGGKMVNLLCVPSQSKESEALFLFATYLMTIEDNNVYFFYAPGYKVMQQTWYPFYDVDIGQPTGDYGERDGVYYRPFAYGCTAVNPTRVTKTLNLPADYKTLSGDILKTVILDPAEGVILLSP